MKFDVFLAVLQVDAAECGRHLGTEVAAVEGEDARVAHLVFHFDIVDACGATIGVDGAVAAEGAVTEGVAIAVDGAVVDQRGDGGVGGKVPSGGTLHGDVGGVSVVLLHGASIVAVGQDEVADGAAGAPLRVVHHIHKHAAGNGEGAAVEGAGGGDASGHFEQRGAVVSHGQRSVGDGHRGVGALGVAAAALHHQQGALVAAAGHRAAGHGDAVVALDNGNLALCRGAGEAGGADGAGAVEHGRLGSLSGGSTAVDGHRAAAAVGGDGAAGGTLRRDVDIGGDDGAAIGAMQAARDAVAVVDGYALHVDGGAVGGKNGVGTLRTAADGAVRDVNHSISSGGGTLEVGAAGGTGIDGRVVAVEAAVVARRAVARLGESASVEVQRTARDLDDVVVLRRAAEAFVGLGHRRPIAEGEGGSLRIGG